MTIPPQELDLQLLEWLRHVDRKFLLVATKADRISGNQLRASLKKLSERLGVSPDRVIPFSAKARMGHTSFGRRSKLRPASKIPGHRMWRKRAKAISS